MPAILRSQLQNAKVVLTLLGVIVVPAVVTLHTVQEPTQAMDLTRNPTPLGYTVSLLIYLVPVLAIYIWFRRRFQESDGMFKRAMRAVTGSPRPTDGVFADYRRSAYRWTLSTLIPIGFVLDVFFGDAFLTFPNKAATLGFTLPAFSFERGRFLLYIPIEEFLFYTLGFTVILSAYIWCDEYWLREYNVPDYELPADGTGTRGLPTSIVQIKLAAPLAISAALVGAAFVYKRFGPHGHHDGFPSYFTFLVLASLLPSLLFYRSTQRFVNWRAVSFAVLCVALTSLLWEATLAAPYGWWAYKPRHMLGLFIGAWYGLPVEAALLWLSVTFTTAIVYEMFKILHAMKRVSGQGWWEALYRGKGSTRRNCTAGKAHAGTGH